jgi:hypothetical protein
MSHLKQELFIALYGLAIEIGIRENQTRDFEKYTSKSQANTTTRLI